MSLLTIGAALAGASPATAGTARHSGVGSGAKADASPGYHDRSVHPDGDPVPGDYNVVGTDVSSNNDPIDWSKVKGSGISFAYVKATQGDYYFNSNFSGDVSDARGQNMFVGAYGLPDLSENNPTAQADYFASKANYHNDGHTLPPFADIEAGQIAGSSTCWGLSPSETVAWLTTYLTELTKKFGVKPVIYTAAEGYWNPCTGSSTKFSGYPLDVASYGGSKPNLPAGWSDWTFWQYTSDANINGSSSSTIDGDVFNGSASELAAFATGGGGGGGASGKGSVRSMIQLPDGRLAVAFRAADSGLLWVWTGSPRTAGTAVATRDGVAAGTTPSIARLADGRLAVAFHANDGNLWIWTGAPGTAGQGVATHDGMAAGTSPSLAVLPNGNLVAAIHAADTRLWTWTGAPGDAGGGTQTSYGLAAGTNPSLAVLPNGTLAVAFTANSTYKMWTWTGAVGSPGKALATAYVDQAGTSPSLAALPNNTAAVALHASSGHLWTWAGAPATAGHATVTSYGMASGTDPSLILRPGGTVAVAFTADATNKLWTWNGTANTAGRATATNDGEVAGTSGSLVTLADGTLDVAFKANSTGKLWTWNGEPNSVGAGTATIYGMG